jgi:hypothetical protein
MNSKFPFSEKDPRQETILVPGIGDEAQFMRQANYVERLNRSRPADALIHAFNPKWFSHENAEAKRKRFLDFARCHSDATQAYGISAGAGLVMSAVEDLPNTMHLHMMCGYLRHPDSVDVNRRNKAPALRDTVAASEYIIEKYYSIDPVTCYAGYMDGVLKEDDMRLPGIPIRRIPMIGHVPSIVFGYARILPKL